MSKKQTPMMEQYLDIKSRYSEELLFFRLGDFYELFNEDALVASRELNITLTGRPTGDEERTPMCGVPFHAAESYIETLVKKGYKVAICEQLEDPKAVKGIVKRDVIKVVTPGTVMTENGNDARSNNFLSLFYMVKDTWILVFSDVSTGEVIWHRITDCEKRSDMYDALSMYRPSEIILPEGTILPQDIQDFIENILQQRRVRREHKTGRRKRHHQDRDHRQERKIGDGGTKLVPHAVIKALGRAYQMRNHGKLLNSRGDAGDGPQRFAGGTWRPGLFRLGLHLLDGFIL